jgi:hypothetical protein
MNARGDTMKLLFAFISIILAISMAGCCQDCDVTTTEKVKYYYSMSTYAGGPIEIMVPNHEGNLQSIHVAFYYIVDDDTTLFLAPRAIPLHPNTYIEGYFTITYKDDNTFTVKIVDNSYLEKLFGD